MTVFGSRDPRDLTDLFPWEPRLDARLKDRSRRRNQTANHDCEYRPRRVGATHPHNRVLAEFGRTVGRRDLPGAVCVGYASSLRSPGNWEAEWTADEVQHAITVLMRLAQHLRHLRTAELASRNPLDAVAGATWERIPDELLGIKSAS
ncbi:hypothetical protein [Leifsonia sp. Leaf264]|uniref:hypothetical protein n=1 Tax=Leifsonia sp. Leaf264 TaxID=1736314 RepID=UPI0006FA214F|nr:hypothetical protein [Leifsonia sp. Leaf264]KQO98463.1 hypothetical protein ASF30_10400 [Leifsonia sp. Leaf264]